jgi:hypothetical protein
LKKHVLNKQVAAVWAVAALYPLYRPLLTQTSSQSFNLVFRHLLSPLGFFVYYLPIQTNSGILASIYHIIFAVTIVFLSNHAADNLHNATPSE